MGKSAAAPPTPDYVGAAKQQGKDNLESARQSNLMSNPNMITPFGNQTVTYSSPTFDQAGYETALAKYNADKIDPNSYYRSGEGGQTSFDQGGFDLANARRGAAPTREAYTTGGGVPTITQTLTPQAQQTLDSQMRVQTALANLGQTGATNAQNVLNTPFNPTLPAIQTSVPGYNPVSVSDVQTGLKADIYGLARANTNANTYGLATGDVDANTYGLARGEVPLQYGLDTRNLTQMPTNAGVSAQQAILSRLDPTIQAGDVSFRQTLANQGLAPGTAAYDAAFRNREMSKNDLYNQAVSQNFGQGVTANQLQNQAIAQNFGQGVTADQLYNSAVGQNFNQALLAQQANNAAQQQQYGQNLGAAQFGNQAVQQSLAQQSALRAQPLNEILGLMGGSQIQLPQFQGYQGTQVAPAPTFAGTQAAGQAALQNYGIQQSGVNAGIQGIASLGGMAAMYF